MTATMDITENFYRALKEKNFRALGSLSAVPMSPPSRKKTLEECKEIDVVVKGEGEDTIIELLRALEFNQTCGSQRNRFP